MQALQDKAGRRLYTIGAWSQEALLRLLRGREHVAGPFTRFVPSIETGAIRVQWYAYVWNDRVVPLEGGEKPSVTVSMGAGKPIVVARKTRVRLEWETRPEVIGYLTTDEAQELAGQLLKAVAQIKREEAGCKDY